MVLKDREKVLSSDLLDYDIKMKKGKEFMINELLKNKSNPDFKTSELFKKV